MTGLDSDKLERMVATGANKPGSDDETRAAIDGALELYLDFVNLFLELLKLFGKSRD